MNTPWLTTLDEARAPWNQDVHTLINEDAPELVCVLLNLADNDTMVVDREEYLTYPKEEEVTSDYSGWVQHDIMEEAVYWASYQ